MWMKDNFCLKNVNALVENTSLAMNQNVVLGL